MLIIAHRGASALAPENTLAAFDKAIELRSDAIEFDIMQVGGEIYVFHDRYLERLTAQPGRLTDLSNEQIKQLSVFGQHPIPTLLEALKEISNRCAINIEIKGEVSIHKLIENIDFASEHYELRTQDLIVSSFNHHWLKQLNTQRPSIKIGALTTNCLLDYAQCASSLGAYSFHIDINFVCRELVEDAHARGLKVFVFTVDEAHDIQWLHGMGVDGIFTNHPQFARNILDNRPTSGSEVIGRYQS